MNTIADEGQIIIRDDKAGKLPLSILQHLYIEKGNLSDWNLMHELHYKSSNLGIGPRYWRCVLDDGEQKPHTIGIVIFTVPKPLDSGRNVVFPHLKPNKGGLDTTMINKMRMRWLNDNLILGSRTVLDTMYRGAGIAYRFRNLANRMMGKRFVESRSSMARYNPFYTKAGMQLVRPKTATALDAGLAFFAKWFVSPAYDQVALLEEIDRMPEDLKQRTLTELRLFYFRHSSMEKSGEKRNLGMTRIDGLSTSYLIKQIQQLVFGCTVYAVWENPDWKRVLPPRIPLSAFDLQKPTEPLRLDLLAPIQGLQS